MVGNSREAMNDSRFGNVKPTADELRKLLFEDAHQEEEDAEPLSFNNGPETGDIFQRDHMPRATHWSISWSDLMMTMFILFLVLYVYKDANKIFLSSEGLGGDTGQVVGAGAPLSQGGAIFGDSKTVEKTMTQIYDLSRKAIEKENLGTYASVNLVPDKTLRIVLANDLLFDSGTVELTADAKRSLRWVSELLKKTPYAINVVGHTDNIPVHTDQYSSNWELSAVRASAVARYMINELGLPAERFYVTGLASFEPVMPNDTPEGRAANRRVEIVITKEKPTA